MLRVAICLCLSVAAASAAEMIGPDGDHQKSAQQMGALMAAIESACSCRIDGVAIGRPSDRSTWRIDFHNSKGWGDPGDATPDQVAKAQAALIAFVPAD